jgi:hypothetical protein
LGFESSILHIAAATIKFAYIFIIPYLYENFRKRSLKDGNVLIYDVHAFLGVRLLQNDRLFLNIKFNFLTIVQDKTKATSYF